jgi:hypothetical protein
MKRRVLTAVLLSGAILSTGCGIVEERKNSALRGIGKAALNSVLRIANNDPSPAREASGTESPVLVADRGEEPATEPKPVKKPATVRHAATAPVASFSQGEKTFVFTLNQPKLDPLPLPRGTVVSKKVESKKTEREIHERERQALLAEARRMRIAKGDFEEFARVARVAAIDAVPRATESSRQLAFVEVHFDEAIESTLDIEELESTVRRRLSIPAPPPPPAAGTCSSQTRVAS